MIAYGRGRRIFLGLTARPRATEPLEERDMSETDARREAARPDFR